MEQYDVVIIGRGPAGISAALYTTRANLETLLVGKDTSSLQKAERIENYFGFAEPVSGAQLLKNGLTQVRRLGADTQDDEVTALIPQEDGTFLLHTSGGDYTARTVLLATGQPNVRPNIPGVRELEGRGVSYCTTCDGFFFRGKKVGVLGSGRYAVEEAGELKRFTQDITIYTNGQPLDNAEGFAVDTRPVLGVVGEQHVTGLTFAEGEQPLDGLFVAMGVASSLDFARKLGLTVEQNAITAAADGSTNLPGVYAAGDCTGGIRQVSVAVGEGAAAGQSMIRYLNKKQ